LRQQRPRQQHLKRQLPQQRLKFTQRRLWLLRLLKQSNLL
jgi:hypothetical protein